MGMVDWRELPQDVLDSIFSKLHPLTLIKANLVCKSWKLAISKLSSLPCAYGFAMQSPSFPDKLLYTDQSCDRWFSLPCPEAAVSFHTSFNSLLCLSTATASSSSSSSTDFHIWNPLSNCKFVLPHRFRRRVPLLCVFCANPKTGTFKVVIAGDKAKAESSKIYQSKLDLSVHVYDSSTNSWRNGDPVRGAASEYSDPACVGNRSYWLSRCGVRKHVLVYTSDEDKWSFLGDDCSSSSSWWPAGCCPYTLWEWKGSLFMAGECSETLTVWYLSSNKDQWHEFAKIPPSLVNVNNFCGSKDVAGHGHLLCVMLVWARKGVVYDLRTCSLTWLPYCPVNAFSWGYVLPYMLGFSSISCKGSMQSEAAMVNIKHCLYLE